MVDTTPKFKPINWNKFCCNIFTWGVKTCILWIKTFLKAIYGKWNQKCIQFITVIRYSLFIYIQKIQIYDVEQIIFCMWSSHVSKKTWTFMLSINLRAYKSTQHTATVAALTKSHFYLRVTRKLGNKYFKVNLVLQSLFVVQCLACFVAKGSVTLKACLSITS